MLDKLQLRKAKAEEVDTIWPLFEQGIEKRKQEGSTQWQDGYPNPQTIVNDIDYGYGYVCVDEEDEIVGYVALIFDVEPAYDIIEGEWLTTGIYAVIHRVIVSRQKKIKGLASWMMSALEPICLARDVYSIKADTNYDNAGMLRVFEKTGYTYCGIAYLRGNPRQAFEKTLGI